LSFHIAPGERIALVGENGAGKTTVTKLLSRLYDPTEGRVLLDGVDLRAYDLSSVRRAVGVIFQDFVRYDLRLDENVGLGELQHTREYLDAELLLDTADTVGASPDQRPVCHAIALAIEQSQTHAVLNRLPLGYRQMLGRRFEHGVDLSGGEWQKVALARAYIRDAQLLILDEPTAALDARAECEVFQRFADLAMDRTTVLISHRFSTVRMADRIIVLRNGLIIEQGSHEELLRDHGLYHELFELQAAGYR
jgi:ATP-binding cassette subfamily B protein